MLVWTEDFLDFVPNVILSAKEYNILGIYGKTIYNLGNDFIY